MSWERPREDPFGDLDMGALGLDEAYVNVTTDYLYDDLFLYKRSDDCDGCPFQRHGRFHGMVTKCVSSKHFPLILSCVFFKPNRSPRMARS